MSPAPWNDPAAPAFVVPWTTGPDPGLDGVFRLLALRPGEEGGWRALDRWCRPYDEDVASARMTREFGVTAADLEGAGETRAAWAELDGFLEDAPVVCPDGEALDAWNEALGGRRRVTVGLSEVAALFLPGRLASRREGLVRALLREHEGPPAALFPNELVLALAELSRRVQDRDPRVLALGAWGHAGAHARLLATDPPAAARLALALGLLERPSSWSRSTGELFHPGELEDGLLSRAVDAGADPGLLDELHPAVAHAHEAWEEAPEMPPETGGPAPFHPDDRAVLEECFERHLPEAMAAELGGERAEYHRPSQAAVARSVADTLGNDELLLLHAPTGTGKTLAYLVPAMLWARRHGARVGVATYTRALQEQAMDGEVPRALAALARAGRPGPTRVSVLKGRENYLCYRALRGTAPDGDDDAETWLAWTQLAVFALTDEEGDLNRLPGHPPVRLTSSSDFRARMTAVSRSARGRTGCCTHAEDRATCAAELARRRAERSHVVLTNQSFALTRREFFRNLVFDECEHLHDVAAATWSHALATRFVRGTLERLEAPLERLRGQLAPGTFARDEADGAASRRAGARRSLDRLEVEARGFLAWRARERRGDDDQHELFGEYVASEAGAVLVETRLELGRALGALETSLGRLREAADPLPVRGAARLRRALDLARAEVVEHGDQLAAWLPVDDGVPRLERTFFHDVDEDERGRLSLRASVLLPNEVLGRHYHPELESAVFLSATTKLSGGFDAARGYLGLDRAAEPAEDEERPPRAVRTGEAPEAFDYGRVLVGVPRDLPAPGNKDAHLEHVTRFLDWLGERTRGRILALFTNSADVRRVGEELVHRFRRRRTPLWYQGMPDAGKEELSALFRERTDSVLLGVDTFWFGADFPGPTLEYLVIVRLPYGVPDRFHHAQRAALGSAEHRRRIYMPRALAKFRQGFGRLMRRPTDRGCVFVLDPRVTDPRHRAFLKELPLGEDGARLVRGDSRQVLREGLAHMGLLADLERRGLSADFEGPSRPAPPPPPTVGYDTPPPPERADVSAEDLPF